MDPSTTTIIWLISVVLPLGAWLWWASGVLKTMVRKISRLLTMHETPDEYGFGTRTTNQIIRDNTRAMEALTHYIQWLVKEQSGHDAPPPGFN